MPEGLAASGPRLTCAHRWRQAGTTAGLGRGEPRRRLRPPSLAALAQRVTWRYHRSGLPEPETRACIQQQRKVAEVATPCSRLRPCGGSAGAPRGPPAALTTPLWLGCGLGSRSQSPSAQRPRGSRVGQRAKEKQWSEDGRGCGTPVQIPAVGHVSWQDGGRTA